MPQAVNCNEMLYGHPLRASVSGQRCEETRGHTPPPFDDFVQTGKRDTEPRCELRLSDPHRAQELFE